MADLHATTALGGDEPRLDRIGGATISENPALALASVAARRGQVLDGADLPLPGPGEVASNGDLSALWLGPDQWMFMADAHGLADRLAERLAGRASVTDQTDAWVCFDLEADQATAILMRLTMLDVAAMQPGQGARSLIEHLGCLLICREAGRRFTLLGPRSSAGSLHHALTTAAASVAARDH